MNTVVERPIPIKTQEHIRRVQQEAQKWKRKYETELPSLRYERNAWRAFATHMRGCPILNNCQDCENLWGIATKTPVKVILDSP